MTVSGLLQTFPNLFLSLVILVYEQLVWHPLFMFGLQQPLVWKCIPWTSLPTVGVSGFTVGTRPVKRSLEVYVMATSKLVPAVEPFKKILEPICGQGNHCCKSLYLELGSDWFALCSFAAVYMDSVPSSCLMLQQG
jgi:hypothetical protein